MPKTLLVTSFERTRTNYGSWLFPKNRYHITMEVMSRESLPRNSLITGVVFTKVAEHIHDDHDHLGAKLYHTRLSEVGMYNKKMNKFAFQYAHVETAWEDNLV